MEDVPHFLSAIFDDPAILPVPRMVRPLLARTIVAARRSRVQDRYAQIGGFSPVADWTRRLRKGVESALSSGGSAISTDHAISVDHAIGVDHAFRYTAPTLETSLRSLAETGTRHVTLLPLFPHATGAMTGSMLSEAGRVARTLGLELRPLAAWGNRPDVIRLWSEYLVEAMGRAGEGARVLFVAHGIPERDVQRGDDYPSQVLQSAHAIAETLPPGTSWSLAYQSRVGPVRWTRPYLEEEIAALAGSSAPLVLFPLSFVCECLETLYDLDIVATQQAKEAGISKVVRVPAFNDDPRFAEIIATMAREDGNEH